MGPSQKIPLFLVFLISIGWTRGEEVSLSHYATYGKPCRDQCHKRESSYYWCTTDDGWDYCSRTENTDYKYNSCRDDHRCGKYGRSYTWCYNKAGSWGYCGLLLNTVEPKMLRFKGSSKLSECSDECLYDKTREYFWCNTDDGYDYCSPLPDVTYKNEPCRSDHHCDAHGYDYSWCWTDSGYNYCGVIESAECRYSVTGKEKGGPNVTVIVCTRQSGDQQVETKFNLEPEPTEITDGSEWRNELTSLITRWSNAHLTGSPTSHVVTTENLRIDLQGTVTKNHRTYFWVEIQARPRSNVIVAQVMVPQENEVPSRYVRMALVESFRRRARVSLDVNTGYQDLIQSGTS